MPKKVDHAARQKQIRLAALEVIAERGIDGVRLADIAAHIGATTGTIAHYFSNKDALLLGATDELMTQLIMHITAYDQSEPLMEFLAAALPTKPELRGAWNVWMQFAGRAMTHEAFRVHHDRYYRAMVDSLSRSLAARGAKGDTKRLADAVIAACDGVGVRATLEPEAWTRRRQRETFFLLVRPLIREAGLSEN